VSLADRCRALSKRLTSLCSSAHGEAVHGQQAIARHEQLQQWRTEADGLDQLAVDPGMVAEIEDILSRISGGIDAMMTPPAPKPSSSRPSVPMPADQTGYLREPVTWRLGSFDFDHPKSWCDEESSAALRELAAKMKWLERYTWGELPGLSTHNHEWEDPSESWTQPSVQRLGELNLDDQSGWYQIHLDARGRLFGFRSGSVFNLVWWDRDHEVYETSQRRKSQR
jgi:hypothetical protein